MKGISTGRAKQPKWYDEAVLLLKDLHHLAKIKGAGSELEQRMTSLYGERARKPSLVARLRKAKLPG